MAILLRYFWFICGVMMLANVLVWRGRLEPLVTTRRVSPEEVERFTRGALTWLVAPCLVLGVISLWARYSTPFCAGILSFQDVPSAAISVVMLICWGALLWWVWFRGGAEFLGRVGGVLGNRPNPERTYSPRVVRALITALLLVSVVGAAVMYRAGPVAAEDSCQFMDVGK